MKKKIVWVVVSFWMVAALLVTSCAKQTAPPSGGGETVTPPQKEETTVPEGSTAGPNETGPEQELITVEWTGTKADGTKVTKMLEKPQYGGEHILAIAKQPTYFDDINSLGFSNFISNPVNETLMTYDWTRGNVGTQEWLGSTFSYPLWDVSIGSLAESWELVSGEKENTLIYHIRQGVHWQNIPPLNGREFTADDVVYALRRNWEVGYASLPTRGYIVSDMKDLTKSIYISPTDKWAVEIKSPPDYTGAVSMFATTTMTHIIAPEVLGADYKKANIDWKKIIGTGAFILKDYVGASSLTYVRNPDYWMHDPFFPENQLPYVDTFKLLIIPDISTQLAGLRTGKIDTLYDLTAENAESLLKTNPELLSVWGNVSTSLIGIRNDIKPFDDVRVRKALNMAINKQEIKDVYYEGKAAMLTFPVRDIPEQRGAFIPLEQLSVSAREIYEYNPDKAKQLLIDAGYPDGFKVSVLAWSNEMTDLLSIVKEYWAKIGVELNIDVRDYSVWTTMSTRKNYSQAIIQTSNVVYVYTALTDMKVGGTANYCYINDPVVMDMYYKMQKNYFDQAKLFAAYTEPITADGKNFINYSNEQAWGVYLPAAYRYIIWQPWLKGYDGAYWGPSYHMEFEYPKFVWIDQALKKSMGR